MTVLLEDGTTGKVLYAEVGHEVAVLLHDENGMPIERTGKVIEVLED